MRNQPAGWSYWVCDCENVHFHRAQILAAVDMPNNDGIHINCCRNVTVSDCNITCGDDALVIRAYSLPMGRNIPCEKVTVTNCNLTSHTCAIRIGYIDDGVMRNMSFSNLNITESCSGITMRLPGNPNEMRMSDQGREATLIENLSFDEIKTKKAVALMDAFGFDRKTLFVADASEDYDNAFISMRNIPNALVVSVAELNVYDIVNADRLVMTEAAAARAGEVFA
mgnify:CR=1 FL=1